MQPMLKMWTFTADDDDDEDHGDSMSNTFCVVYYIIKEKTSMQDLNYFLADYDDSTLNTILWCKKKGEALSFSKYPDAEKVLKWVESLKIKAKIESS